MKTSLIIPTLNELKGLKEIMPRIKPEWYDQLIILDGKSTDGTLDWCLAHNYHVFVQSRSGLWNAFSELLSSGLIKGDIVITFTPDGNSIPEVIPVLRRKMIDECYDMVIASRYKDTARSFDDSPITRFGNHLLTHIINLAGGIHYTDALTMFRAYRIELVKNLSMTEPMPRIYQRLHKMTTLLSWEPSLSIRAAKLPYRIGEVCCEEWKNIANTKRREHWIKHGFVLLTQIIYEGWFR